MNEKDHAAMCLVAVKLFPNPGEAELQEIYKEATITNQIKHEHIVAIVCCAPRVVSCAARRRDQESPRVHCAGGTTLKLTSYCTTVARAYSLDSIVSTGRSTECCAAIASCFFRLVCLWLTVRLFRVFSHTKKNYNYIVSNARCLERHGRTAQHQPRASRPCSTI